MEKIKEGLTYIHFIFDFLSKQENSGIVHPNYIFRGIRKRFFETTSSIERILNSADGSKIVEEIEDELRIEKNDVSDEDYKFKICKAYYNKRRKEFEAYINDVKAPCRKRGKKYKNPISLFRQHEAFEYVKPIHIRSAEATRLSQIPNRDQNDYLWYLRNTIDEIKNRYPDLCNYSDLEILAEFQHKGGASCLVDFSNNILASLWFATQDYAEKDVETGYLFCYDVNKDSIVEDNLTILSKTRERLPIERLLRETQKTAKYNGQFSHRFWMWKPTSLNSRIVRQDSVFVFGIEKFIIGKHSVVAIPIPASWKSAIQYTLKAWFGISGETLYADYPGYCASNTIKSPLKLPTEYFDIKRKKENDKEFFGSRYFQLGTSCLLKAQYETALSYFLRFEAKNADVIKKKSLNSVSTQMIIVELLFSKGMCLHNLGKSLEATGAYEDAYDRCLRLFDSLTKLKGANQLSEDELSELKYVETKMFKLLDDYIKVLYELKRFEYASEKLHALKELILSELSSRMWIELCAEECEILSHLYGDTGGSELKSHRDYSVTEDKPIMHPKDIPFQPLAISLHRTFRIIHCIINYAMKKIDKEKHDDNIRAYLEDMGRQKESGNKVLYSNWDLTPLRQGIDAFLGRHPSVEDDLLRVYSEIDALVDLLQVKRIQI